MKVTWKFRVQPHAIQPHAKCWWCGGMKFGSPWKRDPRVRFCLDCGEGNIDPAILRREQEADMANRPPAVTGGTRAKQSQAADSMRRTLRPQGGTTRSGSPASQAARDMPRLPE